MKIFKNIIENIRHACGITLYRVDVLKYALEHKKDGLCSTLGCALIHFDTVTSNPKILFPLFTHENAVKVANAQNWVYWWPKDIWDTGREEFLKWMIEQYKDDKTNIKRNL